MRKHHWLSSAAGIISIILFFSSLVCFIIAFNAPVLFPYSVSGNISNIFISLATNLFSIIVTVSFVQFFIDKQDEKKEQLEEKNEILRYNRLMYIFIQKYTIYLNCITKPFSMHTQDNPLQLNTNFSFEDMADLHEQSLYLCDKSYEPAIRLFYDAEERLRSYMVTMLENVQFKYNEDLKKTILKFVEESYSCDVRGAILGNQNMEIGGKKATKVISEIIKDKQHDWVQLAHDKKIGPNIMLPYVLLYDLLKKEIVLIIEYTKYLEELEKSSF